MHNSDEELHNSHAPELTWQEMTDLSPEDDVAGGSEIYYFTDEDGNIHSREFLAQELIPHEGEVEGSPKKEPRGKLQELKPGAVDIISLVRSDEAQQQVTLPAPKSGAPRLTSGSGEVAPDLFPKDESQELGVARSDDKRVIIQLRDGSAARAGECFLQKQKRA